MYKFIIYENKKNICKIFMNVELFNYFYKVIKYVYTFLLKVNFILE